MPMLRLLSAMAVTVALGLASRLHPVGWFLWDRVLGEVLYAVAAYLAWAMLLLRKPPLFIAVLAFASCLTVELFKLTGIPAENQHVFLVRWFLGMTFSVVNLGYYLIGVVLIAFGDWATRAAKHARACRPTLLARYTGALARSSIARYDSATPSQGGRLMRRVLPLLALLPLAFAPVPPYRPKLVLGTEVVVHVVGNA